MLGDVVRVIREYRPDVIVTRFPIPPGSGGHGHHTASAILAVEAFKLAADPTAYPEQLAQGLTVWQAKRVVWNSFSIGGAGANGLTGPVVKMDIAGTDPVSGQTFGTIANLSRGMHKTQGLGGFSSRTATGPNIQNFMLLGGEPAKDDLMDGVDLTWNRVPGGADIGPLAAAALAQFKADDPAASGAGAPRDPRQARRAAHRPARRRQARPARPHPAVVPRPEGRDHHRQQAEVVPGEPLQLHYAVSLTAKNITRPLCPSRAAPR